MHLANYAKMSRDLVEVRGICSRTRESGHALARESQLAFVTDDYASLLARDDIEWSIFACHRPCIIILRFARRMRESTSSWRSR
jgi:hypothetical protein